MFLLCALLSFLTPSDDDLLALARMSVRERQFTDAAEASFWAATPDKTMILRQACLEALPPGQAVMCFDIQAFGPKARTAANVEGGINHVRLYNSRCFDLYLKQVKPLPDGWFE